MPKKSKKARMFNELFRNSGKPNNCNGLIDDETEETEETEGDSMHYEYQEYPKHIHLKAGTFLCQNMNEEIELVSKHGDAYEKMKVADAVTINIEDGEKKLKDLIDRENGDNLQADQKEPEPGSDDLSSLPFQGKKKKTGKNSKK